MEAPRVETMQAQLEAKIAEARAMLASKLEAQHRQAHPDCLRCKALDARRARREAQASSDPWAAFPFWGTEG